MPGQKKTAGYQFCIERLKFLFVNTYSDKIKHISQWYRLPMPSKRAALLAASTAFIAAGCLLPWQFSGDLYILPAYGLRLIPQVQDNGGLLLLALAALVNLLAFSPLAQRLLHRPKRWAWLPAALLLADAGFQFALILQRRQADGSVIGATAPAPGIYLLLLGALGMLVSLAGWE